MVGLPVENSPPRKKRRNQKSEKVPIWERTRTFEPEKRQTAALPVVQSDGKVQRLNVQRPKFAVKAQRPKPRAPGDNAPTDGGTEGAREPDEDRKRKRAQPNSIQGKNARKKLEAFAQKIERFEVTKTRVANLASRVLANPEQNVALLKELRQLAHEYKGKAAALVILTESQLYKDILPAYRIRAITEKEAETKVSKDVMRLRTYEEALLKIYQRFVKSCVSLTRWRSGGGTATETSSNMTKVRLAACKALAELIRSLSHFNEAHVIATTVCALVGDRERAVRAQSAAALKSVLGDAHRASGQTLEICVLMAKQLASLAVGKVHAAPAEVVEPLAEIHFARFPMLPSSSKAKNAPKKSKRFIKKRRRKQEKEEEGIQETELERDLREGEAEATPQEMYAARKKMLDSVCHTYFNIIKAAATVAEQARGVKDQTSARSKKPPEALAGALKGLLRVSTFVATDVIEAVLAALTPLLQYGRLPLNTRFRCLSASYAVLAVHAKAQQTDPDSFTGDARAMDSSLYMAIGCLYGPEMPGKEDESVTFDCVEAVLSFLSFREVPVTRCAAVARRLTVLAAASAPTHTCSIGLLRAAQQILPLTLVSPIYPQTSDNEKRNELSSEIGVIQSYTMESDDPDTANAERSAAWELSCLAHHFHPKVSEMAQQCAGGYCGQRLPKTAENILVTVKGHSSDEGGFNPPPQARKSQPEKNQKRRFADTHNDRVLASFFDNDEEALQQFQLNDAEAPVSFFESQWRENGDA